MRGSVSDRSNLCDRGPLTQKHFYIYLMTNFDNKVLYAGVTNDLKRRVNEHRLGLVRGFSSKYHVRKLVYYEIFDKAYDAISREKQIKAGSRQKKLELINSFNREWTDLYEGL